MVLSAVLYLSHVVGYVEVHVDTDDQSHQVLCQGEVLVDNGNVQRPGGRGRGGEWRGYKSLVPVSGKYPNK